jgi:trehalose synthase-fused probable maltokinase
MTRKPRSANATQAAGDVRGDARELRLQSSWENLFRGRGRRAIEDVLPAFLAGQRWFGGKARRVKEVAIVEAVPVPVGRSTFFLLMARVDYFDGGPDTYTLTLAFATGERATQLVEREPHRVVAHLRLKGEDGVLHGAFAEEAFGPALLDAVARRRVLHGIHGDVVGVPGRAFRRLHGPRPLEPSPLGVEQSNTSLLFGDRLIFKLFRRVEPGPNPDVEIGRFLTEQAGYPHSPAVAGAIEYRPRKGEPSSLAIVQQCVANQGDAWHFTLDAVDRYFERVLDLPPAARTPPALPGGSLLDLARAPIPAEARERIGSYLADARLLGRRTAELHVALAGGTEDPAFAPESFTPFYQRSLYQSMRNLTEASFSLLRRRLPAVPEPVREPAADLLGRQGEVLERLRAVLERKITALRTRVHGDYHLGQVLRSGADWVIIDFEGEPALPLSTRRLKRCPLRDTAGMVRSFHYAAHHGLMGLVARGALLSEERPELEPWAHHWFAWVAADFLRGYLDASRGTAFLPRDREELEALLTVYLLEKAVYELGYELNNRPEWVYLPVAGIRQLLEADR